MKSSPPIAALLALCTSIDCAAQTALPDERPVATHVVEGAAIDAGISMAPPVFGGFEFNRDFLRGFKNESALRNGSRDYGYLGTTSLAFIESIEVFKGPASALYGNGKPGGDLNTVSKLPGLRDYRNISLFANGPGFVRLRADVADTADADGALSYRLNLQLASGGDYRDRVSKQSFNVAPVVALRLSPELRVVIGVESVHARNTWDPLFLPNQALLAQPPQRFLGEPGNLLTVNNNTTRITLEYTLGEGARLRQAFFYQNEGSAVDGLNYDTFNVRLADLVDANGMVKRVSERDHLGQKLFVSQSELAARGVVAGLPYEVLAGVEIGRFDYRYKLGVGAGAPLSVRHPVYGAAMASQLDTLADQTYGTSNVVLYAQSRLVLDARTKLLLGMRAERYRDYLHERDVADAAAPAAMLYSPRVGLSYQLAPNWVGALSWTNSSRPQIGARSASGALFKPEAGSQLEASVQANLPWHELMLTTSVFSITKKNVLTQDLASPSFQVDSGRRQSRGAELDLSASVTARLKLDVAAAYTSAYVSRDTVLRVGARLAGVPAWFGSVYLSYDLAGAWQGWGLGGGVVAESRRNATLPDNGVQLAGFATLDATISYRTSKWSVEGSLVNLSDRRGATSDGFIITPANPRELQLSARYKF